MLIKEFQTLQDYAPILADMRSFTLNRTPVSLDEIWFLEHIPVFTQGQAGKPEHILAPSNIPIVQSDRGGQVTYHGPGQLIVYTLLDLKRLKMDTKMLVHFLEEHVIQLLNHYGITGQRKIGAPGVYINEAKIASLGLRVKQGCSYHGLSLNVDMDLSPFSLINPCGYQQLKVTQMIDFETSISIQSVKKTLQSLLRESL